MNKYRESLEENPQPENNPLESGLAFRERCPARPVTKCDLNEDYLCGDGQLIGPVF